MLRAAAFLQKSLEAELAAQTAASWERRAHYEALAVAWRRMAETAYQDNLPAQRLAA